jgi:transposase
MDVQTEVYLESLDQVEVLAGPTGRRKWPDAVKGRLVAESMIPGVSVREVAERNGLMPNRLSSWRGLAKRGILVVPDLAGADFVSIVLEGAGTVPAIPTATPFLNSIELETGGVTLRLDANTSVSQIADLVSALRSAS